MEGPLCKWTNVMKWWQYRYVTLDTNQALLSYYTSKEKRLKGERRGCVRLKGAVIGIVEEDDNTFTITVDQKIFHFQAHDAEDRQKWVSALEDTILLYSHKRRPSSKRLDLARLPTIGDFEKKLIETDAYLQLLNGQIKVIDDKISASGKEDEETVLVDIKVKTLTLIEAIKHTILLLQRAKNDIQPVNGTFDANFSEENGSMVATASNIINVPTLVVEVPSALESSDNVSLPNNTVPETSYSSSEDEDDDYFYDAEEISFVQDKRASVISTSGNNPTGASSDGSFSLLEQPLGLNEKIVSTQVDTKEEERFDICYDEDNSDDDIGMIDNHGSVISHLLGQLKIGMDLSKVALPTFILEKRSLLEMYADFFAHPDVFIEIADQETPEKRFIQVVKWYVSAFHAGRKSSVAKKPYNPILGELFKCHWELPMTQKNTQESSKSEDGPVPWAKTNDLVFIAEQVSHHPPISAFYAEHPEKRITCTAHIYTKSKFLGLSVGVHNIGHGSIYLLDQGEEYICTLPSAYGRSILTVPWMELGGGVTITCPQTGYSANIEFHSKPFYGGKRNKISGQLLNSDEKCIMTLTGEWNGTIMAKTATSNQVFVNTKEMNIIKKKVKPIRDQEDFESRRLWKEVTAALRSHDVNAATNAKISIEQRQRDLVKERTEKNIKWQNRVFHCLNDNWFYNEPLTTRKQIK